MIARPKLLALTAAAILLSSLLALQSVVLSEHDLEEINAMEPTGQAIRLLDRTINGYEGAAAEIDRRAAGWIGKLTSSDKLRLLSETAYNSSDIRVRKSALEIWRIEAGFLKTAESVDRIIELARANPDRLYFYLSHLGILGHNGIESDRILKTLLIYAVDRNGSARAAAINGLGLLGTEGTIAPLLELFHNDPSADLRERAACNLADSGMLSRELRLKAVPDLVRMGSEAGLDPQTRKWVYQALREITHQQLAEHPAAWANWLANSSRRPR